MRTIASSSPSASAPSGTASLSRPQRIVRMLFGERDPAVAI